MKKSSGTSRHSPFTVISWCNDAYAYLAEGLRSDCQRLGYPFHLYNVDRDYQRLITAWCNHPQIIRQGVIDFGTVLFLDVECRIVRPLPMHWKPPLVSARRPAQPFWIRYNTGTVMADRDDLPWIKAWIRIMDDWQMGELPDDAYIRWPNDVCDELAFNAAVTALDVSLTCAELEYVDRSSKAEIARGLWINDHTIIQHPTIHHWPKETDMVECKKLFVQNFPDDPNIAARIFSNGQHVVEEHGWVFDAARKTYAPKVYADRHMRSWLDDRVIITAAQR